MFSKLLLVIVGTIATVAADFKHPVNSEIVSAIRARTLMWTAVDAEVNPFRNYSAEKIRGMLGTILD